MKFKDVRENGLKRFDELKIGQAFESEENVYIKIAEAYETHNSFCVSNHNFPINFEEEDYVRPVASEIIIGEHE